MRDATGRDPLAFLAGPPEVRTVGVVTGAGGDHLDDALAEGLDAFVTGEPSERHMARAQEGGLHFLAAGHYATETFGVKALGDELASPLRRPPRVRRRAEPGLGTGRGPPSHRPPPRAICAERR